MNLKISHNFNLEKKKINFVSYIITVYNKKKYVNRIIQSLCAEGGTHKREFIIVDDGKEKI